MIRLNLLRNRKEGLQRLVAEPGGTSSFVSGREVLLAGLFLVLGGAILWFVLGHQASEDPAVTAGNAEPPASRANVEEASGPAGRTVPSVLPTSEPSTRLPVTPATSPTVALTPVRSKALDSVAQNSPPSSSVLPHSSPAASGPSTSPTGTPAGPRGSTLLSTRSSTVSGNSRPATPVVAGPRSGGVITMRELRILGQGKTVQILAATDGQPEYKMFRVENPDRIVIDMAGVRHEISRENREQRLSNSIVNEVRVAQNQIDPPMVRLVLEVESFPELQILARPDGLLINVTGK
jgi:AMIN domain